MVTRRDVVVGGLVPVGAIGVTVVAGPLDPPIGPVADTSPSLGELRQEIRSSSGGGPLDRRIYADTSSVIGSVTDGKPAMFNRPAADTVVLRFPGAGPSTASRSQTWRGTSACSSSR